ncbi:MAG: hypothetical protein KDA93_02835 [Planctomycetaceae bacterium]|nr:hypothetical protein [Planctomycetaceae bacterium]
MASRVDEPSTLFKLGGSLLSISDLPDRLEAVFMLIPCGRPLIVVGGGAAADVVREWQAIHSLDDETAHQLALCAMSLNESLVCKLLPTATLVSDRSTLQDAWDQQRIPIMSAVIFLEREEPAAVRPLPHDWSATSDSIAAWTALQLNMDRVVLLKSIDLPSEISLQEAAHADLVDSHFPVAAQGLDITWVNLRSMPLRPGSWTKANHSTDRSPHEPHAPVGR